MATSIDQAKPAGSPEPLELTSLRDGVGDERPPRERRFVWVTVAGMLATGLAIAGALEASDGTAVTVTRDVKGEVRGTRSTSGSTLGGWAASLKARKPADAIIVLEHGRIVEIGRHEELLANSEGTYSTLYQLQLLEGRRAERRMVPS